jgi:hypothetical protein
MAAAEPKSNSADTPSALFNFIFVLLIMSLLCRPLSMGRYGPQAETPDNELNVVDRRE